MEMATEGSLSVKLISQGAGCSRKAWSRNARFWRKAVYRETWSTVDGPYDEQIGQCGFACLCDIAAKSTIKEENRGPIERETLICGALDYGNERRSRAFLVRWLNGAMKQHKPLIYWWARQDSNLQPDRYERQHIDQLC
jgi:hypothetical protein